MRMTKCNSNWCVVSVSVEAGLLKVWVATQMGPRNKWLDNSDIQVFAKFARNLEVSLQ